MRNITQTCREIAERKPETRSPHWSASLNTRWLEMKKARKRALKYNLMIDWEQFVSKRKSFQRGNRKQRRSFIRRTEALLEICPNNQFPEATKKDKIRRHNLERSQSTGGKVLNQTACTEFMGKYHEQKQEEIQLTSFSTPWLKEEIEESIQRSKINKAPRRDGIKMRW